MEAQELRLMSHLPGAGGGGPGHLGPALQCPAAGTQYM